MTGSSARGGRDDTARCTAHNTARRALRHNKARPATRRCARGLGAMLTQRARSQGPVCAHCALDPILIQCTVLSHCS